VARILPVTATAAARRLPSLKWLRDQSPYQDTPSEVLIREDRDARG
jgi:hypothetical protein